MLYLLSCFCNQAVARASNLQYSKSVQIFGISILFMTFQYFSENLAPIMLILKPYFSVFLQYFPSKISTSTEESVWLEALYSSGFPQNANQLMNCAKKVVVHGQSLTVHCKAALWHSQHPLQPYLQALYWFMCMHGHSILPSLPWLSCSNPIWLVNMFNGVTAQWKFINFSPFLSEHGVLLYIGGEGGGGVLNVTLRQVQSCVCGNFQS